MLPSTFVVPPSLSGELFLYAAGRAAFETSPASSNKLVLLGGLSDGLYPTPYTARLSEVCSSNQWSLVQPILSSSYTGFGHGSLDRDAQELDELLDHLVEHRSATTFGFIGHSTGCQDIVHYLKRYNTKNVQLAVLQAPVSDREHAQTEPGYQEHVDLALQMVNNGYGQELMPRSAFWAPITAQRLLDLHQVGGVDDYFSSDYSDTELQERLGHMGKSCLNVMVVWSGTDEYVPETIDGEQLLDRLVSAMNAGDQTSSQGLYLPTANHNLSIGDADLFLERIQALLKQGMSEQPSTSSAKEEDCT